MGCYREVPGEQITDPADGMVGDTCKDLLKVDLRVEPVELAAAGVHSTRPDECTGGFALS